MIKLVDASELTKLELQINSSELYTRCEGCENLVGLDNCEDYKTGRKFKDLARQTLENKLLYDEMGEDGVLDASFHFCCPICLGGHKLIPLKFTLESVKQVMLFKGEMVKMPVLKGTK